MRVKGLLPVFAIILTPLPFIHRAKPFSLEPERLSLSRVRIHSRLGSLTQPPDQSLRHASYNKPFLHTLSQSPSALSALPFNQEQPASSTLHLSQSWQHHLSPFHGDISSNKLALTQVLHSTIEMLNTMLTDESVTIEGRVKSQPSQLGKRLKLKLAARVGEEKFAELCTLATPAMESEIKQLVTKYWVDLYQTTLEHKPLKDIIGVRIILNEENHHRCYQILQKIIDAPELRGWYQFDHSAFEDYIQHPKANGYQSLHGSLQSHLKPGLRVELQIRNHIMHHNAVHGSAQHSHYKSLSEAIFIAFTQEQDNRYCLQKPGGTLSNHSEPFLQFC